LNTVLNSSC